MKGFIFAATCLFLVACQGNIQDKSLPQADLKTQKDTISYSIGVDIGKNLKAQEIDINPAALAAGLRDATGGGKFACTDAQMQDAMMRFRNNLAAKAQEEAKTMGEKNQKDGEKFLAENKTKEGVKVTASGLQYKVIKEGTGPKPKADQTVTVNYRGTLIDGTEFDNSFKRNQPATFPLNNMIKGWIEGVQLMSVGSRYEFYIPTSLAYADNPPTRAIPPGSTLIFEVELLSFK